MFIFEFDHLDWLSQIYSEWRQTSKLVYLKISAKVRVCNSGQIWKLLNLLNSVPFIKKTLLNHVYIEIGSSWLTFTLLQWMKTNFEISPLLRFLLRLCDSGQNLKMTKTS